MTVCKQAQHTHILATTRCRSDLSSLCHPPTSWGESTIAAGSALTQETMFAFWRCKADAEPAETVPAAESIEAPTAPSAPPAEQQPEPEPAAPVAEAPVVSEPAPEPAPAAEPEPKPKMPHKVQ
jgi:hypothetical protein